MIKQRNTIQMCIYQDIHQILATKEKCYTRDIAELEGVDLASVSNKIHNNFHTWSDLKVRLVNTEGSGTVRYEISKRKKRG